MQPCVKTNKINAFKIISFYMANGHLGILGNFQIMTGIYQGKMP